MLALMPRLADFELPESRTPEHLWSDDAKLLRRWLDGKEECLVHVAVSDAQQVLGFTLVRLRPELLSHEPSAHLEAIAIDKSAEGCGVARLLLSTAEQSAREQGARSMTLHVFSTNKRATEFYERNDYFGELIRYIKDID